MTKRSSKELSERQDRVYTYVRDHIAEHGYAPSIRQIAQAAGLASTSSVAYVLSCLQDKGYLNRTAGRQAVAVAGQVMVAQADLCSLLEETESWAVCSGMDGSPGYKRLRKAAGLT